jgi:hypothetical protein
VLAPEPDPDLESLDLESLDLESLDLESLDLAELSDVSLFSVFFLALAEAYPSEYQPPPFRRNPVPPEIWRLAVALSHFGQSLRGASLIDWEASHSWLQAVQIYS